MVPAVRAQRTAQTVNSITSTLRALDHSGATVRDKPQVETCHENHRYGSPRFADGRGDARRRRLQLQGCLDQRPLHHGLYLNVVQPAICRNRDCCDTRLLSRQIAAATSAPPSRPPALKSKNEIDGHAPRATVVGGARLRRGLRAPPLWPRDDNVPSRTESRHEQSPVTNKVPSRTKSRNEQALVTNRLDQVPQPRDRLPAMTKRYSQLPSLLPQGDLGALCCPRNLDNWRLRFGVGL